MVLVTLVYEDHEGKEVTSFNELERIPLAGEVLHINEKEKYTVQKVVKHTLNPEKNSKAKIFLEK